MWSSVLYALGGLGLFLLGMSIMTGALRVFADERLRGTLAWSVDNPWKGALMGTVATALLQSSSATTVAAVGFVGAGVLSFSESLGVIFGANIGTTMTGWLVAIVGFKLNLGQALLPLILVGAMLRLTGRPRLEQIGMAVAGFGLIFVGIGNLQTGLEGLQESVTPTQFPPDTCVGRVLLVLLGATITLVTQSSSAGVATALAAVNTGTISLNQAAAMVIGMDLGTTATAAMATIGGNVNARRTGFAHVIYNSLTAVGAFLLLTPYMSVVEYLFPGSRITEPEFVLVGFHTFFNALGVLAILPFTRQFADLIVSLFPERGNPLTQPLDRTLLGDPAFACIAVQRTSWDITAALLGELKRRLENVNTKTGATLSKDLTQAIDQTTSYLQELATTQPQTSIPDYVASLHVLDHLRRMNNRLHTKRLQWCREDHRLAKASDQLTVAIEGLINAPLPFTVLRLKQIRTINHELKIAMRNYRLWVAEQTATGTLTAAQALRRMDTMRWLRRIGYHIWRISYHLTSEDLRAELSSSRVSSSTGSVTKLAGQFEVAEKQSNKRAPADPEDRGREGQ